MVVINSFKERTEAAKMDISWPSSFHIAENYAQMMEEGGIMRGFRNSVLITVVCVAALVLLCSAMAFVIQRKRYRFPISSI